MSSQYRERTTEQRQEMDIRPLVDDLWKGLKKYGWLFLLICGLLASFFYWRAKKNDTPYYTAYSTFTVNANVAVGYRESTYNQTMAAQIGQIFPYLVDSGVLQTLVSEELGSEDIPGRVEVEVMEGTNLITIRVHASTGQLAYEILESVIRNYPKVGEYVLGDTKLERIDESGIPAARTNPPVFGREAVRGASLGALLSLAFLVWYALTRHTIRREEDLKQILNIRCIGQIPRARLKKRRSGKQRRLLLDQKGTPSVFVEAVRTLRARMEREMKKRAGGIFMITSAVAGEGKSTVAANLALALAARGYSVILMDADLRKPSLHTIFGLPAPERGFCEVIEGMCTLKEALLSYGNSGLQILPGSRTVPNPAQILNDAGTKNLIEQLGTEADCVLIDTSPSAIVADSAILARYVQGSFFVVRQDYARADQILEGVEMLSESGSPICGCILNGMEAGISDYGYGGYGYGKYGLKGDGHRQEEKQKTEVDADAKNPVAKREIK